MIPVPHSSNNDVLHPPAGLKPEECQPLHITRVDYVPSGLVGMWSYWQPSAEEVAAIASGKSVRIAVMGRVHPPIAVGVDGIGDAS